MQRMKHSPSEARCAGLRHHKEYSGPMWSHQHILAVLLLCAVLWRAVLCETVQGGMHGPSRKLRSLAKQRWEASLDMQSTSADAHPHSFENTISIQVCVHNNCMHVCCRLSSPSVTVTNHRCGKCCVYAMFLLVKQAILTRSTSSRTCGTRTISLASAVVVACDQPQSCSWS